MSVKFAPGPHPSSKPRYGSPYPAAAHGEPPSPASTSAPASGPASPTALTSSPQQLTFSTRPHRGAGAAQDPTDPESQPLLAPAELARPRTAYPAIIAVLVVVLLAIVGIGGWRLGKGVGGGRWPGGPH